MPNPYGNKNKCRTCYSLAGKDGWCRRCRPQWKSNRKSVNWHNKTGQFGRNRCYNTEYGFRRDEYPIMGGKHGRGNK